MPTGDLMFISLEGRPDLRWNANDSANKNSVIHLDNAGGSNCCFRLDPMGGGWYGVKHILSGGPDRFVDVDGKSTRSGAVLHLWESSDSKVSGKAWRQFAFIRDGQDEAGNDLYYIQNRNSGLYMGVEDKDLNSKPKVLQTDKAHARRWYVTPSTFPLSGSEENVLQGKATEALVEIYLHNGRALTDLALNQRNDSELRPHFYRMGTTSKWELSWRPEYQAFVINSIPMDSEELSGRSMDVDGQSGKVGAGVNLWSSHSFEHNYNTSQLWRFERRGNGVYAIRNARSGLYLQKQSASGVPNFSLSCGNDPVLVCVSVIATGSGDSWTRTGFDFANDWMASIPDAAMLSSVNIPGTHDTGTASVPEDKVMQTSIARCQYLYFSEQLNVGTRSFDIRCDAGGAGATADTVQIVHGGSFWKCTDRDGSDLKLGDVLDQATRFLDEHPSESLVMLVKADAGDEAGLENAMATWVSGHRSHVWCGGGIPSMDEARGKIVFLRRFRLTKSYTHDEELARGLGLDVTLWNDLDFSQYHALSGDLNVRSTKSDDAHVVAQDAYNLGSGSKYDYISDAMRQSTSYWPDGYDNPYNHTWVYNYTSCAGAPWVPFLLTRDINPKLFSEEPEIHYGFLGMVMLNFANDPMCRLIYETNDKVQFEPKVEAPTVTLERGRTLAEAQVTPAVGTITGSFSFDDPTHVVTEEEAAAGTTFSMTFAPKDARRFRRVKVKAAVTLHDPEALSACIYQKRSVYGSTPTVMFVVDDAETLSDEELAQLFQGVTGQMTVTVGGQAHAIDASLPVGSYVIDAPAEVGGHAVTWRHASAYDLVVDPVGTRTDPIRVQVPNASKTYGETLDLSTLALTVSGSDQERLSAAGATVGDLGISLKAVAIGADGTPTDVTTDAGGDDICGPKGDAGTYAIVGTASNTNFTVEVEPSYLTVTRRTAGLAWPGTNTFAYTGSAPGISVGVTGLLDGDSCEVANLRGADGVNVGSYTTVAWGLTNGNYVLPRTAEGHTWTYTITQATPAVTWPTASLTYGQTLAEATLAGGAGEGTFAFDAPDTKPEVSDSGTGYAMTFIPSDPNYRSVTGTCVVTVSPVELTVVPDDAHKTYGDTLEPGLLTWSLVGEAAGDDTLDELAAQVSVSLSAGEAAHADAPVGTYPITGSATCANGNYTVSLEPALATVEPRPVTATFEGEDEKDYDGEPIGLTVRLSGVLWEDDVYPVLDGDDEVEPGHYEAEVTSLAGDDAENYVLDSTTDEQDAETYVFPYTIDRAVPQVTFPTSVALTYGQTLGDATLAGQSGDGSFAFADASERPTVEDSGTRYRMTFTPTDETRYRAVEADVEVTVLPREVSVVWDERRVFEYTGNPVSFSATLAGVLDGDECAPEVEGGTEPEPGLHLARVTGLVGGDADNYVLAGRRARWYAIKQPNDPDPDLPDDPVDPDDPNAPDTPDNPDGPSGQDDRRPGADGTRPAASGGGAASLPDTGDASQEGPLPLALAGGAALACATALAWCRTRRRA